MPIQKALSKCASPGIVACKSNKFATTWTRILSETFVEPNLGLVMARQYVGQISLTTKKKLGIKNNLQLYYEVYPVTNFGITLLAFETSVYKGLVL